jgi:drug/metabolite transporter (DMT)-like permease
MFLPSFHQSPIFHYYSFAIIYALCCLFFSAFSDFVFKLFANSTQEGKKSTGSFVSMVGIVWFAFMVWLPYSETSTLHATLLWGAISGSLSLSSNILLIESMKYQSAGISSTIFRLNMVLVVIGAFFLLGEPITPQILVGVICAFGAIIAFIPTNNDASQSERDRRKAKIGFALSLAACLLRAGMGLSYKYGFDHQADVNGVTTINALFWVLGGLAYHLVTERNLKLPGKGEIKTALLSGVFVSGIVFFMARMNATGNASVVNPIAQMSFLGTFALSAIFLKEKMTPKKICALLLGIAAIIFLTL